MAELDLRITERAERALAWCAHEPVDGVWASDLEAHRTLGKSDLLL